MPRARLRLPTEPQTRFLQACLLPPEARGPAFAAWSRLVGDPLAGLGDRASVDRQLLPLLYHALGEAGVELPAPLASLLRAATVHEELRAELVGRSAVEALTLLAPFEVTLVGGLGLAYSCYPRPALRHCHNVDLLVPVASFAAASEALGGYRSHSEGERLLCWHPSGTPLALQQRLYRDPLRRAPVDLGRAQLQLTLAGARARRLEPADQLVESCAHGSSMFDPGLRFLADAALLLGGAELDWERVVAHAALARAGAATARTLAWLDSRLGLGSPAGVRRRLALHGAPELARDALGGARRRARRRLGRARGATR